MARPRESLDVRFWKKVRRGKACWVWTGYKNPRGYGIISAGGSPIQLLLAHRVSWVLSRGEIPNGMCVMHKCDNPPCVNPKHLVVGTQAENLDDMRKKGRDRYRPLFGENNPRHRLTDRSVLSIRKSALSHRELGIMHGVARSTITAVKSGRTWEKTR